MLEITYRLARRIVIAVVGTTTVLIGVVMLVTPGPGLLFIPAGLAILGMEFAWARYWLKKLRRKLSESARNGRRQRADAHHARVYTDSESR
ncbi:MAG: PGPGW domain-containing protein [Woeseiaceae bacterium]|nr:PGPGW domain-containing protein [Woeseiaceae bacterium]